MLFPTLDGPEIGSGISECASRLNIGYANHPQFDALDHSTYSSIPNSFKVSVEQHFVVIYRLS
jgi:hypothetical protein